MTTRSEAMAAVGSICPRCYRFEPCSCPPVVDEKRLERNRLRARRKGYKTAHWNRVRAQVLKRDRGRCRRCGSTDDLTVHVVDGRDHRKAQPRHCETLCRPCHGRAGAG